MAKTEVAVKENTLPALNDAYNADAGGGFEETTSESFAIPFLSILQSGSPQVKKSDGAYIKGAEEGMLFNSVTNEVYSGEDGVEIIPCHYTQRYIEWALRDEGGGFFGEYLPSDPIVTSTTKDEKGRQRLQNGHQLVDTRNHYVLIRREGQLSPAIISMSSTQIKESKRWMSMMQGVKVKDPATGMFNIAPMFSNWYKLTTSPQTKDQYSWFGYHVELGGKVAEDGEYSEAKSFNHAVKSGMAKVERNMAVESASNEKEKF